MNALKSFSAKQPILFMLLLVVLWLMLMMLVSGITAGILHKPYDNVVSAILGRAFVVICGILLLWKLDWLETTKITSIGRREIWLFTLGGLIYYTCVSLYSFYGKASFDFSILARSPAARPIALTQFMVALNEEILFRGIVLYLLTCAWSKTAGRWTSRWIGSVLITSLLFAILHATQIFTDSLDPSAAWYLVLGTFFISIWWGALALVSGSIWPSVLLHFVGNAAVVIQGLSTPMLKPGALVYERLMWFGLALGMVGMGLLVKAASEKAKWKIIKNREWEL